jgi:two-component system, chemotaxis family, sensor kinase CheA
MNDASASGKDPLGDLAVRLLQATAADVDELKRLRRELARFAAKDPGPDHLAAAGKLAAAAVGKLDELLRGESDPDEALDAAVQLVCRATSLDSDDVPPLPAASAPKNFAPSIPPEMTVKQALLPTLLPPESDAELVGEFLTEANEHVVNAEAALLTLEQHPDDAAAVNTVFRAFHTVKGVSAMLGMTAVAQLAHHAESLLSRIREGEIRCTGAYANLCLRAIDMLKETLIAVARQHKGLPAIVPAGYTPLVSALKEPPENASAPLPDEVVQRPMSLRARPPAKRIEVTLPKDAGLPTQLLQAAARPVVEAAAQGLKVHAPESASAGTAASTTEGAAQARPAAGSEADSSVRVRTDRLDRLIDMVGELVIAHSMLGQETRDSTGRDADTRRKLAHTGKIVRELQDLSMSLRMVPLRPTLQKLTRIVRDVANKSRKTIQFISSGDDTEVDRNMVDVIAEPLIHMVRNAADHGVESAAERIAAGKPAMGTVRLDAYHSGGSVAIDMSDDGAGLNSDRILAKAIQKGLIDPNRTLSESEIFQLIFLPGFSTTENVTDISGRGVGMDVVRRNIEKVKGRIEISSERGRGTKFSIRLPLTLAITDGMIVRVGKERYIIPTVNIAMNFRPEPAQLSTVAGRGELILLRGELISLFRLHQMFRVNGAVEDPTRGLVVVLRDGVSSCGILVDELLGQQQVVAKTLGAGIVPVAAISGGAILGDGRVGLILDPTNLIAMAKEFQVRNKSSLFEAAQASVLQTQLQPSVSP